MLLYVLQFVAILLAGAVAAMFLGPWAAVTRSLGGFGPEILLPLVRRLNANMEAIMTPLMPAAMISSLAVAAVGYKQGRETGWAGLLSFLLLLISLVVTMAVEVPLVRQMCAWTADSLPSGWERVRDRWLSFHLVRIVCGCMAFASLVAVSMA